MLDKEKEKIFLDGLVKDYTDEAPYSVIKKHLIFDMISSYIQGEGKIALEMGCANDIETELLSKIVEKLVVIDGSHLFIEKLKASALQKNVEYIETLFEDYHSGFENRKFDYVVCNYILEYVYNVEEILRNIRSIMHKDSLCFITVPNCNALSRKLALEMGLVESLEALTENDNKHGHRRTFDFKSAKDCVMMEGFEIIEARGVVLKILADFQLNKLLKDSTLTEAHIQSLNMMAKKEQFIDLSDSIFLVLKPLVP
jgi:2-polyprenyl-3-methyl-5-hydroxy-6-metoxy-1,4-benzoquinol methylase